MTLVCSSRLTCLALFCDYCDVYLTHDSMSVRKAHNSGKNHLRNVVEYYQQIGHDKAQSVIDSITSSYAAEGQATPMMQPPPGGNMPFPPPPFAFPNGMPPPFPMNGPPPNFPPPMAGRGMPPFPFPMPPMNSASPAPGGAPQFPPSGSAPPPKFAFPPPGFPGHSQSPANAQPHGGFAPPGV